MATNNFLNHENGIFVLQQMSESDAKENLIENGWELADITEEAIQEEINMYEQMDCEEMFNDGCGLNYWLTERGYTVVKEKGNYSAKVYNKTDKLVAELTLESGYYAGVQVIVETDPDNLLDGYYDTQAELLEQYTPHHKRLLKLIGKYTTPLLKVAQFSNGEAIYKAA